MKLTLVTGSAMIKWHTLFMMSLKLSIINLTQSVKLSWFVSRDPGIEHSKHALVFLFESALSDV